MNIEDNPVNQRLIERVVALRPNVHLETAATGGEGLDLVARHRPALVLVDLHLPDIHGETVVRRLAGEPGEARPRIVVVSADAARDQVQRLREAGADDYLTKPVDVTALLGLLDELDPAGQASPS